VCGLTAQVQHQRQAAEPIGHSTHLRTHTRPAPCDAHCSAVPCSAVPCRAACVCTLPCSAAPRSAAQQCSVHCAVHCALCTVHCAVPCSNITSHHTGRSYARSMHAASLRVSRLSHMGGPLPVCRRCVCGALQIRAFSFSYTRVRDIEGRGMCEVLGLVRYAPILPTFLSTHLPSPLSVRPLSNPNGSLLLRGDSQWQCRGRARMRAEVAEVAAAWWCVWHVWRHI
jgi:hypothetical protein